MKHESAFDDESSTQKSRRVWLSIFILIAMIIAYVPLQVQYQGQIALSDRIWQAGGHVETQPTGPNWIRGVLGEKRMRGFDNITEIFLVHVPRCSDEWLKSFGKLTELKRLSFKTAGTTDAGLQHLQELINLQELYLFDLDDSQQTEITSAGVEKLQSALPKCEIVWVTLETK